jgi:hypothetical protein
MFWVSQMKDELNLQRCPIFIEKRWCNSPAAVCRCKPGISSSPSPNIHIITCYKAITTSLDQHKRWAKIIMMCYYLQFTNIISHTYLYCTTLPLLSHPSRVHDWGHPIPHYVTSPTSREEYLTAWIQHWHIMRHLLRSSLNNLMWLDGLHCICNCEQLWLGGLHCKCNSKQLHS